jgi:hypothetical protein
MKHPTHDDIAVAAYYLFLWKTGQGWVTTADENWLEAQHILNVYQW